MQILSWCLLLSCALLSIVSSQSATYIVDNQNAKAADTNAGTREAPFKTIGAAARKAQAGDEVVVRPGTYRGAVTLSNSGKAGQPIVFRSEVPRAAILSGSDVISDWKLEGPGTWSMSAPDLKKIQYGDFGNSEWIYVNGYPLQRADSRNRLAPGSFFHDFDSKRVWVMPEEGQDIQNLRDEYAWREGLLWASKPLDDIHLIGFTMIHNADWFRGKRAIAGAGQRWLIENNHVLWASYGGSVTGRSNGSIVRNNLVEWCGAAAIGGASTPTSKAASPNGRSHLIRASSTTKPPTTTAMLARKTAAPRFMRRGPGMLSNPSCYPSHPPLKERAELGKSPVNGALSHLAHCFSDGIQ